MISRKTYLVAGGVATAIVVAAVVFLLLEIVVTPGLYPADKKGRRTEVEHQERVPVASSAMTLIEA